MATIVIDAGHGGYDPGAVALGRNEKDDNLRLALRVSELLRTAGYNVVMTRDSDIYLSLSERANISNAVGADLFVSLHRNSSTNSSYNGLETYVYTSPSALSLTAANNVNNAIASVGVQTNHGVKYANFAVLRETTSPAILVELNFVSNELDNTLFDTRFEQYANAIVTGIEQTIPLATLPNDRLDETKDIQTTLNYRYGTGLVVDGYFGALTKSALIKALQSELNWTYGAGLAVDGIYGTLTQNAVRSLRFGDRNYLVYILQALLFFDGYSLDADTVFGTITQNAVIDFQARKSLAVDGIAGKNTFTSLINSI